MGAFRLDPHLSGLDPAAHKPLQDAIEALFVLQAAISESTPTSTCEGMFTQEQLNQAVLGERQRWDVSGDNKKGLEEAIEILQVLSGVRTRQ